MTDVSRFEAIAYAQASKGARFLVGCFVDRFENQPGARLNPRGYTYKLPKGLEVEVGDLAIVQVLDGHFGIVEVTEILIDPPSPDQYDYTKPMKWAVGAVDKELSLLLTESDRTMVKVLSRVSVQSRVKELSEAVGVDLTTVDVPRISVREGE